MNSAGGQPEKLNFNELWRQFKSDKFSLTIDQATLLFKGLSHKQKLTEPLIDDIMYAIKVPKDFYEKLMATRAHPRAPYRRMALWQWHDTTTFAAVAWEKGCITNIHDHSHFGLTRTLKGSVTSIGYRKMPSGKLKCLGNVHFEKNRVYHVPAGDSFIHSIANFGNEDAIELHFYGPNFGRPSYSYEPVEGVDLRDIKDGDEFEVTVHEDPDQLTSRFG